MLSDEHGGRRDEHEAGIFSAQETTEAAMRLFWRWIELYGIPVSIYVDKKTVYVVDGKVRLAAKDEGREDGRL